MKKFILFSEKIEQNKKEMIKKLIIEHCGKELGDYLEINDESLSKILKIIVHKPYNVICEEQQSTKIMKLGNKQQVPPKDPYVKRSEFKAAIKLIIDRLDAHWGIGK